MILPTVQLHVWKCLHNWILNLAKKIAVVEHSEVGDPYQAYTWVGVCHLAKKWCLYIQHHKCACAWMKLVLFVPPCLHFLFHPSLPTHIEKMDKILATSQDYLWEWINACKELCDSWMESAIGTEIKTELLNSAVGFTQSAANNWVLRFQAEQHPPPLANKGTDMAHICALRAVWQKSNQQTSSRLEGCLRKQKTLW